MNLPSLQLLVLHTYEELLMRNRTAINVFWAFVTYNYENQELIFSMKFPSFISSINSKWYGSVGGN